MFGKGKAPRGGLAAVAGVICGLLALFAGPAGGQTPTPPPAPKPPARSEVYLIRDPGAIDHFAADRSRVHTMVDRLVIGVTGRESVPAAWRSLVEPKDVVGIKISAAGGASGATHHAVVEAIVDGLLSAGVPRDNLLVWDRDVDDLRAAGYLGSRGQPAFFACPVRAIEARWGYNAQMTYSSSLLGKLIWGDYDFRGKPLAADGPRPADAPVNPLVYNPAGRTKPSTPDENLSTLSHYANILANRVTKIIDVPVFADNEFAGVGGALYNVTIPNVDNWRRLVGQPQYGSTAIPELYSDPVIGGRVVLCLMDGLVAQIAGAPAFQPLYARDHATLYASRDAVALDAVVLRQLEAWRSQAQLPPIGDTGAHIRIAGDLGLGNFAAEKIDLRRLSP